MWPLWAAQQPGEDSKPETVESKPTLSNSGTHHGYRTCKAPLLHGHARRPGRGHTDPQQVASPGFPAQIEGIRGLGEKATDTNMMNVQRLPKELFNSGSH